MKSDSSSTPQPHMYCDLWQITGCQAVGQFGTSKTNDTSRRAPRPQGSSSKAPQRLTAEASGKPKTVSHEARIASQQQHYHQYDVAAVEHALLRRRSKSFNGGVILGLRPPLSNRHIITSTMAIAVTVANIVNEAVQRLK